MVEELFGGVPRVLIRVNVRDMQTTKLKSAEMQAEAPSKKQKISPRPSENKPIVTKKAASNFQDILKSIKKDKKPVSPSNLASSQSLSRPVQPASQSLKDLINDFKQFKEQQGESGFKAAKEQEVPKDEVPDMHKTDPNLEYKQLSQYRLERVGLKQEAEAKKRHGDGLLEEPVKRSRHEEMQPEGQFSSDSEELLETKPANPAEKSEEYSVLDFAHRESSRRSKKKRGKMYEPLQTSVPKNKAPIGSLLRVWSGKVEYNKNSMMVDMFSIDNIELFQRVPQLPARLEIQGRTKQAELEAYLTQSTGAGTHKVIITSWVEAGPGYESAFRALSRDLAEKDRAAVIRHDSALSIYITCLTDTFKTSLNNLKLNVLQKVDKTVSQHISEREKLACILVFKKSSAGPSSSLLDPSILLSAEQSQAVEEEKVQEQPLSPITSDEEPEQTDAAMMVQTIISKLERGEKLGRDDLSKLKMIAEENPSPELSNLIATINTQIEQPREERAENNVAQFLSQQHGTPKPQARYGYEQKRPSRFS